MKEVTIALNDDIATLYLKASREKRKKAESYINRRLKDFFKPQKESIDELFKTMDEISAEAKKNGLTPEILEQILQEINKEMKNERG